MNHTTTTPHETNPHTPSPHRPRTMRQRPRRRQTQRQSHDQSPRRIKIRITSHRLHPLNIADYTAGCHHLLYGLHRAGLFPGQATASGKIAGTPAWDINLETVQHTVSRAEEEKTIIEILPPDSPSTTTPATAVSHPVTTSTSHLGFGIID